jgi:cytochrome b561
MNNKPLFLQKYSLIARLLHWISALLVISLFISGWYMVELDYYSQWYITLPELHILGGVCLLVLWALIIFRLFVIKNTLPELNHKKSEAFLARWIKRLFYLLLTVIIVCGYLIATADGKTKILFDFINLPALSQFSAAQIDTLGWVHENLAYVLMFFVVLHVLGALKHHFIDKDSTLKRML